ncbi:hypothetical protein B0J14DRAFT_610418 [Halenospora varia]|nr:hypothetical protein B0J14DRAFT_610418 [Halenospora varia]
MAAPTMFTSIPCILLRFAICANLRPIPRLLFRPIYILSQEQALFDGYTCPIYSPLLTCVLIVRLDTLTKSTRSNSVSSCISPVPTKWCTVVQ